MKRSNYNSLFNKFNSKSFYFSVTDPEKIERVKKLYEELALPITYSVYEEESYNMIKTHIQQISRGLPHGLFFKIMETIYRRDCWVWFDGEL